MSFFETDKIGTSRERRQYNLSREEYLEFITHQPYDAMGNFSFLLDEQSDKAENTTVENENMNAD